jgi:hypothetical protein
MPDIFAPFSGGSIGMDTERLSLVLQGQTVNAITRLDGVLRAVRNNLDALLLMGNALHLSTASIPAQQKLDLLKEGAQHHLGNSEVQVWRFRTTIAHC